MSRYMYALELDAFTVPVLLSSTPYRVYTVYMSICKPDTIDEFLQSLGQCNYLCSYPNQCISIKIYDVERLFFN